jgi:glycosyltransferase involved in cell wall biosynthesis
MEALACGTPVVSFATGGSLEMLDTTCGCGVPKNDVDEMERMIRVACEERPYTPLDCVKKAEAFQAVDRFKEYVKLYEKEDSFPD